MKRLLSTVNDKILPALYQNTSTEHEQRWLAARIALLERRLGMISEAGPAPAQSATAGAKVDPRQPRHRCGD